MSFTTQRDATVYAAGSVLWRVEGGKVKVLLIHRKRHQDYSFPKGKVDVGETLPETAVREIWEETGYRVGLDAPLGFIDYPLPSGRPKEVHYWSSHVSEEQVKAHSFASTSEVDGLEWVTLKKALQKLSYERDRALAQVFADRVNRGTAATFPVIALRHATAIPAQAWPASDETRPLTSRGQAQAERIVPILRAYSPTEIVTSTAVRCRATVAPLAAELALTPRGERALSQSATSADGDVQPHVAAALARRESTVICSHSPVMPEIVAGIAHLTRTRLSGLSRQAMLSTAECSIVHIPVNEDVRAIVAAETHGPII